MNTLFEFEYNGDAYVFKGNPQGKELIEKNGVVVSEKTRDGLTSAHEFVCDVLGDVRIRFDINLPQKQLNYVFESPEQVFIERTLTLQTNEEKNTSDTPIAAVKKGFSWAILGLIFKLFKSAGAIKVALAGTALAGWAWLFTFEFAVCLVAAIFIHELGHVLAMKQSGLKVKGIYLIPFLGGAAVSEASKTRWQDFKIAIAGPAFGSLSALIAWGVWSYTDNTLIATFALISLMLNLFNLLPIVPLDGGQALKALVFSKQGHVGFILLMGITTLMVALSFMAGFYLLVFFGILGAFDLFTTGKQEYLRQVPLSTYGIVFCTVIYLGLLILLGVLAYYMAQSGIEGANIPLLFLSS
jgi:Zn-dependent protease